MAIEWTYEPEDSCDEHFACPVIASASGVAEVDCTICGASGISH